MENQNDSIEGTGAQITEQEATDLLHRLATLDKVLGHVTGDSSLFAFAVGKLRFADGGSVWIVTDVNDLLSAKIGFHPASAILRTYGDDRTFSPPPQNTPPLKSALCFLFPDGSKAAL
jgi:hypothetical protein